MFLRGNRNLPAIFLATALLNLWVCSANSLSGSSSGESWITRERLLIAVENALNYYERDSDAVNVDGLFGLRVAEGQLQWIRKEFDEGLFQLDNYTLHRISNIIEKTEQLAKKIYEINYFNDGEYLARFAPVVSKPYMIQYNKRKLLEEIPKEPELQQEYNENYGDMCFADLFGTNDKPHSGKSATCYVSDECFTYNTLPGATGYFLTHQLLYFVIATHTGCSPKIFDGLSRHSIDYYKDKYCSRIYQEALQVFTDIGVYETRQDLFAEQILLCGPLGYLDFAKIAWAEEIMQWQTDTGCFKPDQRGQLRRFQMRRLLREQFADDGCLAHKTGLATGSLAFFLRIFLREGRLF